MKTYTSIAELIQILEDEVQALTDNINTLKEKPLNFNEEIIFKYIETSSTGQTKDFVRAKGVKSARGGLFSSGDVTKIIKDGADDISPKLLAIAREAMNRGKKNGMRT